MYPNTHALTTLKQQSQETLNFTVLIANSVPLLKKTIKSIEAGDPNTQLATPDFFKKSSVASQLKSYACDYKANLSKYVLLSSFSFFEAYVTDAIKEMICFHGGLQDFCEDTKRRCENHVNPTDKKIIGYRAKLQDSYKKKNSQKYIKYSQLLRKENYRFPSELLASLGVQALGKKIDNLKSADIPDLLTNGLHFKISAAEIKEFDSWRSIRNNIAHGNKVNCDMSKALKCNSFLRSLAVRLDLFLVQNYFVIEKHS